MQIERGHHALLEEEDVFLVESEMSVPLEERAGGEVVGFAGHDVPGDGVAGVARPGEQLLGEDLEERFIFDRRDGELALGPVVAEARSLPAGDEERGDFSLLKQQVAAIEGVGVEALLSRRGTARISSGGCRSCARRPGAGAERRWT